MPQPVVQQAEQGAAMDSKPVGRRMQVGVGKVEDYVLEMIEAQQAVDPRTQPFDLLGKPEMAQHGQAGRLQQQTGPGRPSFSETLEDGDAVSGVGEKRRGRLAGDTTSDDADLERSDWGQRPPLTTRHWPLT